MKEINTTQGPEGHAGLRVDAVYSGCPATPRLIKHPVRQGRGD